MALFSNNEFVLVLFESCLFCVASQGLEFMQDGQRKMAFSCFKLAADQNYSKAQFNVGLCYEHGRGTKKDMAKVQSFVLFDLHGVSIGEELGKG